MLSSRPSIPILSTKEISVISSTTVSSKPPLSTISPEISTISRISTLKKSSTLSAVTVLLSSLLKTGKHSRRLS